MSYTTSPGAQSTCVFGVLYIAKPGSKATL